MSAARGLALVGAYVAGLTMVVGAGVMGIDAANASTERVGRLDNFRAGAGLDTSQVVSGAEHMRGAFACYGEGTDAAGWKCVRWENRPDDKPDSVVWPDA